jgi:hypothetical protein
MAETQETTTTKKTTPKATPKAEPKSKIVHFYFPKSKGASYGFEGISVKAKNHIITLDGAKDLEAYAIKMLRNDKGNGVKFIEIADKNEDSGDIGKRIDVLIDMDYGALVSMLGGALELHRLSRGGLIAKALELD